MLNRTIAFLLLLFAATHLCAQETAIVRSDSIAKIDGQEYIIHTVAPKQTLFGIAKAYSVKLSRITFDNPGVLDGLKTGQHLRILRMALGEADETAASNDLKLDGEYVLYTVPAQKTLYSISKEYNTTITAILDANPELSDGLKVGSTIRIPTPKLLGGMEKKVEMVGLPAMVKTVIPKTVKGSTYTVTLLLPFYLSDNDTLAAHRQPGEPEKLNERSEMALQFYEGFLMAVDSLHRLGYPVQLKVLDTENRPWKVQQLIKQGKLDGSDLIIGPYYSKEFKEVAEYGRMNCIPVVSPTIQGTTIIADNPYVFKLMPSDEVMVQNIGAYLSGSDSTSNMVLHYGAADEQTMLWKFRQGLGSKGKAPSFPAHDIVKAGRDSVHFKLSPSKRNDVVILSNNEVKLSSLVRRLADWSDKSYVVAYVPNSWDKFKNIDIDLYARLRVHMPRPFFVDFSDMETQQFVLKFRQKFKTEPNTFAFRGYDLGMHFIQNLAGLVEDGPDHMLNIQDSGLQSDFRWVRTADGGYENAASRMVDFTDLDLKRATD